MNETPDAVRCPAFRTRKSASAPGIRSPQRRRSSIALHHLPNRRAPGEASVARMIVPTPSPRVSIRRLRPGASPRLPATGPPVRRETRKAVSHRRPEGKTLHRHRAGEKSGRRDFRRSGRNPLKMRIRTGSRPPTSRGVRRRSTARREPPGVRPGNGIFDGPAGFEDLAVEGPSDIAAHADAAQRPFHHGACVGKKTAGSSAAVENARDGGTQNAFLRQHEPGKTQEALAKAGSAFI